MPQTAAQHDSSEQANIADRLRAGSELVIRSGMEIARLLDAVREDKDSITADFGAQGLFLSRLVQVDAEERAILVAYSEHKPANAALLAAQRVVFSCYHRGQHYRFAGREPRDAAHDGTPVIRLALPMAVLARQPRSARPRLPVLAEVPLQCRLRVGTAEVRARLVDVSLGGLGVLLCSEPVPIVPGTRLECVAITHPQHAPVIVDLEICHVARVSTTANAAGTRIGCRLLAPASDLETLIRLFIIDLL
jgi:c-di-GMP-binding flagellar brake protein YcgR